MERRRKQLRLKEYDYSQPGAYFVTICTKDRRHLFGGIKGESMHLNPYGRVVQSCWEEIPDHYPQVQLDEFVLMPNHMHGIIVILEDVDTVGARHASPQRKNNTLGDIVGSFKYAVTKRNNESKGVSIWQRGFFEHIIRDGKSLDRIREYIATNPQRWQLDRENPEAKRIHEFCQWIESAGGRPISSDST